MFQWQSALLSDDRILHGCTDKSVGAFRYDWADKAVVDRNRAALKERAGLGDATFVAVEQVHGNGVMIVDASLRGQTFVQLGPSDAMITKDCGLALVIKSADCVPILLFDPTKRVIAAIHSGWQGTAAQVIGATAAKLRADFGVQPANLLAAIGPAICAKHYDVTEAKDDRIKQFETHFGTDPQIIVRQQGRVALDLPLACKKQCLNVGISEQNIDLSGICNYEDSRWASYRREKDQLRHDILSYILLK